jgi:outer membrane receptor protein involved in Fe transport
MARLRPFRCLTLLAVATMISIMGFSQTTGGRILGRVTDPTGAVVPNVTVTLSNDATGVTRTARTNQTGDYSFLEVPVGNYSLTFDSAGFKKNVRKGVTLQVNQVLTLDMKMQLGSAQETVDVTSEAPLVDTTTTQLGAVVDDRSVVQLPLNQRDTYQFLQLQPGVQSQVGGNSDTLYGSTSAGAVSVNGGRGRSNNFSVNGGDANDQFVNLPAVQPSPDSIQEFRVITNTFDAEYGRNSGAVVNVVTKSGTNSFHGDTYEFLRNRALNAKGYFDTTKPTFIQNQFGGTFGGPIKKDRTFFFTSYEGRRIRQGTPGDTVTVPTSAQRNGDFSQGGSAPAFSGTLNDAFIAQQLLNRPGCASAIASAHGQAPAAGVAWANIFPNNQIPVPCMDATAVDLMNQYVPLPNTAGGFFQAVPVSRVRGDQFTARVDHKLTEHQNLTAYYYFNDDNTFQPFSFFQAAGANVPGFGSAVAERFQQYNATHTWTINNSMVNEFRATYMREGQGTFQHPQNTHLVQNSCATVPASQCFSDPTNPRLGITPGLGAANEGVPFISVSGGFVIGNNFEGELPQIGNTFQFTDNVSKIVGNHTMKFGIDTRRMRFDQRLYYNVNGYYTFVGGGTNDVGFTDNTGNQNLFPNYLLGLPDTFSQGSAQNENVRDSSFYLFAQDSWKVKPNLTLNYGLRWELDTPLTDKGRHVQTFRPGQATKVYPCQLSASNPLVQQFGSTDCGPNGPANAVFPLGLVVPGDPGVPAGLTQTYYKAFAPRIGLAYSPGWDKGILAKLTGGPGKTSVHTGWGIFYNPMEQLVLEQFSAEPPFGGSSSFANTMFNTPFAGQNGTVNPNPFNGILSPTPGTPIDWSAFRPILLYGEFQPSLRTQYAVQYNFTIQRQIRDDFMVSVGYVGSQGHRLLASHDLNYGNPQTCLDLNNISNYYANTAAGQAKDPSGSLASAFSCGPFYADSAFSIPAGAIPAGFSIHMPYGPQPIVQGGANSPALTLVGLRPYSSPNCNPFTGAGCPPDGVPVFSSIFAQDTIGNSNYNSLQAMLEKKFSSGLQLQAAYTFSKSIDDASSFEDSLNPLNFALSRALSQFSSKHRFVVSYYWQLPVPKFTGAKGKLLDGWAMSGITQFQSGFPNRMTSSDDLELMNSFFFYAPGEPNMVAPLKVLNPHQQGNYYFDPNGFQPQAMGTIGNTPRTICCGPGTNNWDVSFQKRTNITERTYTEFRAEFFNVWNHTQFYNPDGNISDGVDFGRVKRARDPRLMQVALKLYF